jgi:NAD(P)-dependent dehydrogenase (short-subunit alcohol dehydrogenase family)
VCIITGGNAGLGLATAKELVKQGYHVIITCRTEEKGREAVAEITSSAGEGSGGLVEFMLMDLNSLKSVRSFADSFRSKGLPLHRLINNAGIMVVPFTLTEDGVESQYQVNHLGHFLLTHLLLDILEASAPRIINLSSRAHYLHEEPIDYDKLQNETESTYDRSKAYGRSKLTNILFTYALHRRLNGDKKPANKTLD